MLRYSAAALNRSVYMLPYNILDSLCLAASTTVTREILLLGQ